MSDVLHGMRPFYSPNDRSNPHLHVPVSLDCPVAPSLWSDADAVRFKLFRSGATWAGEGLERLLVWARKVQADNWELVWPCSVWILDSYDVGVKLPPGNSLRSNPVIIPPVYEVSLVPLSEHAWLIGVLITPQKPKPA